MAALTQSEIKLVGFGTRISFLLIAPGTLTRRRCNELGCHQMEASSGAFGDRDIELPVPWASKIEGD